MESKNLEEEVYKCRTCRGTGKRYKVCERGPKTIYKPIKCNHCGGSGYVDWIDNIKFNEDGGFFTGEWEVELPRIRSVWPKLIAEDLISVQPMVDPRSFLEI